MSIAELMRKMTDAGAPLEAVMIAVEAVETVQKELSDEKERQRSLVRERVRKHRQNNDKAEGNDTVTLQKRNGNHAGARARVEDNTKTNKPTGKNNTKARDLEEFKSELSKHTDSERIDETVKHRRRKNGALTGYAARLLISEIRKAGLSISEGLDMCIERNWITVKADWLQKRHPRQNSPPTDAKNFEASVRRGAYGHEPTHNTQRHNDQSDGAANLPSAAVVNFPAIPGSGGR